jgi:Zn2+/Cd2+-exporting ATPase
MACCCHDEHEHHHEEESSKKAIIILAIRIALSLAIALFGQFLFNEEKFNVWVNFGVMMASYIIIAYDVLWEGVFSIVKDHRPFDEHLLMTLASLGAFALRFFGPGHNEFFEAVLVMLLYQIGEVFEDLAEDKSREAITSALDIREEKAKVEEDGKTVFKAAEELSIGDKVIIGAGEKVLCDGEVIDGVGFADESSLTGESLPIGKKIGDAVYSGTLLKEGSLTLKVSKEYKESTVAKLLDLVENSASKKSRATRFITKFARVYTPIVTAASLLIAVLPPLFINIGDAATWSSWIFVALEFLIVSCPCAIVISVPLAYFAGLGLASKKGVVVKGAEYFDKINELKLVCFDKTGTLTEGRFAVKAVCPSEIDEALFLEYLSAAESRSSHPLAKAIVSYASLPDLANEVSSYQEESGYGVSAVYKEHHLFAGKSELLRKNGINCPDIHEKGSITYLSIDGKYAGYILLGDLLRANSKSIISGLSSLNVRTMLLSGDKEDNVKEVADALGIDEAHGALLPKQKQEMLKNEIDKGKGKVAFVGDGINDAPSIVLADIGIAMGGLGSDLAVSNADVVLMQDDPIKIITLIKVARKTRNRALFNIAFSLCVKVAIMVLSLIGASTGVFALPLWVTVFGDSGVALLAVLSSLLLSYSKAD